VVLSDMNGQKRIRAAFYQSPAGKEPVREWLLELLPDDRKRIGDDIRTAEFGWPVGMPICRQMKGRQGIWEVRTNLPAGRIARVFFCLHENQMVLLHGIIKKSQKTPVRDLDLAEKRRKELQ